jgi:Holliday junction resolvasome RuvABC endonuclease subunit
MVGARPAERRGIFRLNSCTRATFLGKAECAGNWRYDAALEIDMADGDILALDPATTCGWAVCRPGVGVLESGSWRLRGKSTESDGLRFMRFEAEVKKKVEEHGIKLVFFEAVMFVSHRDAFAVYSQLVGVLKSFCLRSGMEYMSIPVGTIKKFATGKGNAKKDAMLKAAELRWPGAKFTDDNEVDARWVAETGLSQLGLERKLE